MYQVQIISSLGNTRNVFYESSLDNVLESAMEDSERYPSTTVNVILEGRLIAVYKDGYAEFSDVNSVYSGGRTVVEGGG